MTIQGPVRQSLQFCLRFSSPKKLHSSFPLPEDSSLSFD